MLEAKGRIRLLPDCLSWVRRALAVPGFVLIPFSLEIAIESTRLPGALHGDPADRIIAATARVLNGTLVTKNKSLIAYGQTGAINVLPV